VRKLVFVQERRQIGRLLSEMGSDGLKIRMPTQAKRKLPAFALLDSSWGLVISRYHGSVADISSNVLTPGR
jgi:hypothetical protein